MTQPFPGGDRPNDGPGQGDDDNRVVVVGPGGMAVESTEDDGSASVADLVEQPAKVMRIGGMIRQLLEEVRSAPLDEPSRARLAEIYDTSISELEKGLAPELSEELRRLTEPFTGEGIPTEPELRVAKAQLVGWLEGLFQGIQTALVAQQMAARAQFEELQRRRALPGAPQGGAPGASPGQRPGSTGQYL